LTTSTTPAKSGRRFKIFEAESIEGGLAPAAKVPAPEQGEKEGLVVQQGVGPREIRLFKKLEDQLRERSIELQPAVRDERIQRRSYDVGMV